MWPYSACCFMSCLFFFPRAQIIVKACFWKSDKPGFKSSLCDCIFPSLGKPHNVSFSQPQFPPQQNGNVRSTHLTGLR